jgi:hypothetical protein
MKFNIHAHQPRLSFWMSAFLVLIMVLPLGSTQPASARPSLLTTTWYVAPTGNDSNSCTAPDVPCLTVNGAIGKATADDVIKVAIGTYTGSGTEVVLIDKNITLLGGWDKTFTTRSGRSTINGQDTRRGVTINAGPVVVIDRFAIQNGLTRYDGGGIHNEGALSLSNSLLSGNRSKENGGGIYNLGALTVRRSTIRDNTAYSGGAILNLGTATLDNSTLNRNRLTGFQPGSAINNSGTLILNNSTINGNTGSEAIYNSYEGKLTLNNSTISGNKGPYSVGGGIVNDDGLAILNSSTVTGNTSAGGSAGIYARSDGTVILRNSILAGNTSDRRDPDCRGPIQSYGYNLIGNGSGCQFAATAGDRIGTSSSPINPLLGPLQNNGGPTFTHALSGASPALNAGNPNPPGSGGNTCPATDQRGAARPVDDRCDIGAYEGYVTMVIPLSPEGKTWDRTPSYKWSTTPGATNYAFQLLRGTTLVYSKTVPAATCGAKMCTSTPTTLLSLGAYKWRVRPMVEGVWKPFSTYKNFTIFSPTAGYWDGYGVPSFYVSPNRASVRRFSVYFHVPGCGYVRVTRDVLTPVLNGEFSFDDVHFYASGTFNSPTNADGTWGLISYYIAGCGYVSRGPLDWIAVWVNSNQPSFVPPGTEENIPFILDPVQP